MLHWVVLLPQTELLQPLLLQHGLVGEGAGLLIRLAPSAADDSIDSTVQNVEALLDEDVNTSKAILI